MGAEEEDGMAAWGVGPNGKNEKRKRIKNVKERVPSTAGKNI